MTYAPLAGQPTPTPSANEGSAELIPASPIAAPLPHRRRRTGPHRTAPASPLLMVPCMARRRRDSRWLPGPLAARPDPAAPTAAVAVAWHRRPHRSPRGDPDSDRLATSAGARCRPARASTTHPGYAKLTYTWVPRTAPVTALGSGGLH